MPLSPATVAPYAQLISKDQPLLKGLSELVGSSWALAV